MRSLLALIIGVVCGSALAVFPAVVPRPRAFEISFIPRTSGTTLSEGMHRGADRAVLEGGSRLYWNAPTREDDVDRQIFLLSSALGNNTRGLILGPTNGPALITKINNFIAHRIPIVVVQTDAPVPDGPFITSVTPDQDEVGRLAATRILRVLRGGGQVAVLGLDRVAPETLQRSRSFRKYMMGHPEVQIVAEQRGTSLAAEAEQNAGDVLDAFPHLRGMFGVSATATDGAIRAIHQRGLQSAITLVGCDDDYFLINSLHEGSLDSLVITDNEEVGYLAAKSLLHAIGGGVLLAPQHVKPLLLTREDRLVHR